MSICHSRRRSGALLGPCAVAAVLLAGCSQGDVEVNGAIFDYLGVSSKSNASSAEAKLPPRVGIVLPPSNEKLPEPGSGAAATVDADAMPVDPERRKVAGVALEQQRHEEKCKELLWKAKVSGNADRVVVRGPLGVCNQSILSSISSNTGLDTSKQGIDPYAGRTGKPAN